jgi:hypothetical protein
MPKAELSAAGPRRRHAHQIPERHSCSESVPSHLLFAVAIFVDRTIVSSGVVRVVSVRGLSAAPTLPHCNRCATGYRSLAIALQENRNSRGVGGKGIDRCPKYRGMTTPSANGTKLPHDIKSCSVLPVFSPRPTGVVACGKYAATKT